MKRFATILSALALVLAGCVKSHQARAAIAGTDPASKLSGAAAFTKIAGGVRVDIQVSGAPAGTHAIHIHEHGQCGDSGKAAGGHFNPANVKHGFLPKDGPANAHAGDMGNIAIDKSGRGALTIELPGLTLDQGPLGIAGRSVVLHEKLDDFGQPTGNAGGRIGCGVILAVNDKGDAYPSQ